jgi:ferredoxin--NADP+ reductase
MMQELIGAENLRKIRYYPTTTREESPKMGRITTLLQDGTVFKDLGIDEISVDTDRAMVCGSMGLNKDIKVILEGFGLEEGANSDPKHYVIEKAFVG